MYNIYKYYKLWKLSYYKKRSGTPLKHFLNKLLSKKHKHESFHFDSTWKLRSDFANFLHGLTNY